MGNNTGTFKQWLVGLLTTTTITAATLYYSHLHDQISFLKEELNQYEYAEPFFTKIPANVDMTMRRLRVTGEKGNTFSYRYPDNRGKFTVFLSNVAPDRTDQLGSDVYTIMFRVRGVINNNVIADGSPNPLVMTPGSIHGPFHIGFHNLYIHVDSVAFSYAYLSIALQPSDIDEVGMIESREPIKLMNKNRAD